jgi:hypothetical protein
LAIFGRSLQVLGKQNFHRQGYGITGKYYPQLVIYSETKVLLCSLPLPEFKLILMVLQYAPTVVLVLTVGQVANLEKVETTWYEDMSRQKS